MIKFSFVTRNEEFGRQMLAWWGVDYGDLVDSGRATDISDTIPLDLRMSVAKAGLISPLTETDLSNTHSALVVGGGIAGMQSALDLAAQTAQQRGVDGWMLTLDYPSFFP